MSTRWIIAEQQGDGWRGRYVHNSGYPGYTVGQLLELHERFDSTEQMIDVLVHQHTSWSYVDREGSTEDTMTCHCHVADEKISGPGPVDLDDPKWWFTHEDHDCDMEWAYVLNDRGFSVFSNEGEWLFVGVIPWGSAPDSELLGRLECGENYERCEHYASVHFPEAGDLRIGTKTWLGLEEFSLHDATHVIVKGRTYRLTGSGSIERRSPFSRSRSKSPYTHRWLSTVEDEYGGRIQLCTEHHLKNGTIKPAPGVTHVYPTRPCDQKAEAS